MTEQNKSKMFQMVYFIMAFALVHLTNFLFDFSRSLGYSLVGAGFMLSVLTVGTAIGQIVIAYISDKIHKVKAVIIAVTCVSFLASLAIALFTNKIIFVFAVFILGFTINSLYALIDTWVLNDEATSCNFSKILAASPVGRAIAAVSLGLLFDKMGYGLFAYTLLAFSLLSLIPYKFIAERKAAETTPISLVQIKRLLSVNKYRNAVFLLFLTYMGVNTITIFSIALLRNLGGGSFHIGLFSTLSGIVELFLFLIMNRFTSKVRPQFFIILVCASVIVHLIGLILAGSYVVVLFLSVLNAVSFSMFLVGAKMIVNEVTPAAVIMTGQAIGSSIFYSLSATINSTFSGFLADSIGIKTCLLCYVVFMAVLTIIQIYFYIKNGKAV